MLVASAISGELVAGFVSAIHWLMNE